MVGGSRISVFLSGPRRANVMMIQKYLKRERASLLRELPQGAEITTGDWPIAIYESGLESDSEKCGWIIKMMNAFANVLRPRLRKWYEETLA